MGQASDLAHPPFRAEPTPPAPSKGTPVRRILLSSCTLVALVASTALATSAGADPTAPTPLAPSTATASCPDARLAPRPAAEVLRTQPRLFAKAATRSGAGDARLRTLAQDHSLMLDGCGRPLYAEKRLSKGAQLRIARREARAVPSSHRTATARRDLDSTFQLESRPGSDRTLYLDFTGMSVTGTAWNSSYAGGGSINVPTFSTDASSSWSADDLTTIQRVWQIVSEDYAPFDVNVTTRWKGTDAMARTSASDTAFGARVIFAGGNNPIYRSCGCGGLAYVGVFNASGDDHDRYQPAWVFTQGVGTSAKTMGEAAAHEAGHLFGLFHDGTPARSYSVGATPWAPIMGASYYQPITQWSRGEYLGANMKQDDLAVIAAGGAPLRRDDVGDDADGARVLWPLDPVDGVISTRSDVDAFKFTASGTTTVSVAVAAYANLDVRLRVATVGGDTVATANPSSRRTSDSTADGLSASATFTAAAGGATYVAYVDGVGHGSPLAPGGYSDYASLGNYEIDLATSAPRVKPLSLTTGTPAQARTDAPYSSRPVTVRGGRAPYRYQMSALPRGLRMSSATGRITGTPQTSGTRRITVTVTDRSGSRARTSIALTVAATHVPLAFATSTTLPSLTVGVPGTATVRATGGTAPYTFRFVGTAPRGVSLRSDGATATLSGTPRSVGQVSVSLELADATGATVQRTFVIPLVR